ncbi:ribonuclease III [Lachnospiraceae bacterium oral taxon 500]|nr:ribonuclease III [Lachnospiraceae bacterium oral taxon 500]
MDIFADFLARLQIVPKDIKTYSPLSLAYLGDNIFDLFLRYMVVAEGNAQAHRYHERVTAYVKAGGQAAFYEKIKAELTEEEQTIFKRGRNAKTLHVPKHSSPEEYAVATGVETLLGYLFLKGEMERLSVLMAKGVS